MNRRQPKLARASLAIRSNVGRRAVALLGVEGLAVIDTSDALLVARLDRSAQMRELVAELKARGRSDIT